MHWKSILYIFVIFQLTLATNFPTKKEEKKDDEVILPTNMEYSKDSEKILKDIENSKKNEKGDIRAKRKIFYGTINFNNETAYHEASEHFKHLSKEQKIKFLSENIKNIENTHESVSNVLVEERLKLHKKKMNEENAIVSFVNFIFFVIMIFSFMYCIYLVLVGCTQPTVTSYTVREPTINSAPTMYNTMPTPPPAYDNTMHNIGMKR
uniref:Uncharacterized protein n=1 Tax=Parastrongyloides trichosuri TaxID=131310 RepID=A0A0N4ZN97_PARTI